MISEPGQLQAGESDAHDLPPDGLLRAAARLVERALSKLDTSETTCGECAGRHFNNLAHAKTHEAIAQTPEKLRRAALRLQGVTLLADPEAGATKPTTAAEV